MLRKNSNLAPYIDHTFLNPAGSKDAIRKLCREAKKAGFASVCVHPYAVPLCVKLLKGSHVKVGTVVGFPLGQDTLLSKCFIAIDAVTAGAQELDFVINQRLLKHDPEACFDELRGIMEICREMSGEISKEMPVTKLILECCNLTKAEIVRGCKLAKKAGFAFVKTSTGFGAGGATVEDVKLMRKTVGPKMGVKAAGGIRDRETALKMIAAGATRIGTSAGLAIVAPSKTR